MTPRSHAQFQANPNATPIAKVIHLEPYSDAVGIGREGKEARDVYLLQQPARLLLYVHWIINHKS